MEHRAYLPGGWGIGRKVFISLALIAVSALVFAIVLSTR